MTEKLTTKQIRRMEQKARHKARRMDKGNRLIRRALLRASRELDASAVQQNAGNINSLELDVIDDDVQQNAVNMSSDEVDTAVQQNAIKQILCQIVECIPKRWPPCPTDTPTSSAANKAKMPFQSFKRNISWLSPSLQSLPKPLSLGEEIINFSNYVMVSNLLLFCFNKLCSATLLYSYSVGPSFVPFL